MILDRLAERIRIDWRGFAVTHGGFFGWFGPAEFEPWPGGRPPEPEPAIVATGGIAAAWEYMTRSGWDQWRRWHLVPRFRLSDMLPTFSAPRGGISWLSPPITDDPYSHLGPGAPPPPSWPAQPAPELPPQPGQPTWNLLEPEQRSISDLIRLRLRRRH